MHYGEPVIRRTVPLALGILSASNPVLTIMDTLSRYSHDNDLQVAMSAIFAMGLVGAGTNNARLAQMLRQLASYYNKEPDCLFVVRIAQVRYLSVSDPEGVVKRDGRLMGWCCSRAGSRTLGQGDDRDQPIPHGSVTDESRCGRWAACYDCRFHRHDWL